MLVDIVGIYALAAITGILFAVINTDITNTISELPTLLLGTLLYCLYYIPQEALTGRTLGKLVAGTRIRSTDGKTATQGISFRQATVRTLVRLVPGEPLTFIFDEAPVGWHDRAANTEVIRIR